MLEDFKLSISKVWVQTLGERREKIAWKGKRGGKMR
jgi:hypothetical protein